MPDFSNKPTVGLPGDGTSNWGEILNTLLDEITTAINTNVINIADKAPLNHNHNSVYVAIAAFNVAMDSVYEAIALKANANHNHNSDYAAINHDHNLVYATISALNSAVEAINTALALKSNTNHNHDADYAEVSHNHNADYSAIGHDHNSIYALATHSHSGYAASSHNHAGSQVNQLDFEGAGNMTLPAVLDRIEDRLDALDGGSTGGGSIQLQAIVDAIINTPGVLGQIAGAVSSNPKTISAIAAEVATT